MSRQTKAAQVYSLGEAERHVHAVVRYDGDPDVFTALAGDWVRNNLDGYYDAPIALCPPEPRLYRWNVAGEWGEYPLMLGESRRSGRGVWTGSLLRVIPAGCEDCQRMNWQSHADGCLNAGITNLVTLQFTGPRGVLGPTWIHAVRQRADRSTPGNTLCGLYRFEKDSPGWSVGGGNIIDGMRGCYSCRNHARDMFPGLPIHGALAFAKEFAGEGTPLAAHLVDQVLVKASNRTAELVRS